MTGDHSVFCLPFDGRRFRNLNRVCDIFHSIIRGIRQDFLGNLIACIFLLGKIQLL